MSYKYRLVPEVVYNQFMNNDSPDDVLNSRLPPEAKVSLYQEKVRNLQQQKLNRENKPINVHDPTLQAKIEQVLNLLKPSVDETTTDEHVTIPLDEYMKEKQNIPQNESTQENPSEPRQVNKRRKTPIKRSNKKLVLERKSPINFQQEIQQEFKDKIKSIRRRDTSQYRFKPCYQPIKPKYGNTAKKRKIEANAWEEYLESGTSPKATIREPPPLNISKLMKQRKAMDKKVLNKRLTKDDQDAAIPKRSQRLLNNKVGGWKSYKF